MNQMKELRSISLDFRRISSNLLRTSYEQADVALTRFYNFINGTNWICNLLQPIIAETDYDFRECFMPSDRRREFVIPLDEKKHIKAQYDYMRYIIESEKVNILGLAMKHCINEKKFDDMVQVFFSDAFKPLIDYINDSISKEMILIGGDTTHVPAVNIGNNYGTANIQGKGTINSTNTVNLASNEIKQLIEKIMPSLEYIQDVPEEEKVSVQDDLESIQEQLVSATPKKNRLQKALNGIKEFVKNFPMSLAVNMATTAIVNADWVTLIQQIELFVASL